MVKMSKNQKEGEKYLAKIHTLDVGGRRAYSYPVFALNENREFKIIVDVPIGGQKRLVPKTEFKKINETLLAYVKNFPHSIRPFDEVLYDS